MPKVFAPNCHVDDPENKVLITTRSKQKLKFTGLIVWPLSPGDISDLVNVYHQYHHHHHHCDKYHDKWSWYMTMNYTMNDLCILQCSEPYRLSYNHHKYSARSKLQFPIFWQRKQHSESLNDLPILGVDPPKTEVSHWSSWPHCVCISKYSTLVVTSHSVQEMNWNLTSFSERRTLTSIMYLRK